MGQSASTHEEHVAETAAKKFEQDRARLSQVRRALKGPQDPYDQDYRYLRWIPRPYDPTPPVPYFINPQTFRVDRDYSNKPVFMYAYDRRNFRRQPNIFPTDPDYSTCTYTPVDHRRCYINPEVTPSDWDVFNKMQIRNPYPSSENPYDERTNPPTYQGRKLELHPPHVADPYKVHFLDERGNFRPAEPPKFTRTIMCDSIMH